VRTKSSAQNKTMNDISKDLRRQTRTLTGQLKQYEKEHLNKPDTPLANELLRKERLN
jgi:hypothetical protein